MKTLRSLAVLIARWAVAILPHDRTGWGRAMQAELDYVPSSVDAFWWALGCARFAIGLRLALFAARFGWLFRLFLVAVIAAYVGPRLPPAVVALSLKSGELGIAEFFASTFMGTGASVFIPLIDELSWLLLVSNCAQLALYSAAGLVLFGSLRRALAFFAAAFTIQSIAWMVLWISPTGRSFSSPEWLHDLVVWSVMLAAGALLFFLAKTRVPEVSLAS